MIFSILNPDRLRYDKQALEDTPGTFWPACRSIGAGRFGRFDGMKKMNHNLCRHCGIEEMTECSIVRDDTDGHSTIDEGTEKPSFRVGRAIPNLLGTARLDDEAMVHFLPQDLCRNSGKSNKTKRTGCKNLN